MKTIEIVGMVGAGKTTLARELTHLVEARGYVPLSRVEAIRLAMDRSTLGVWVARAVRSQKWHRRAMILCYRLAVRPAFVATFAVRNPRLVTAVVGSSALKGLSRQHRSTISKLLFRTGAAMTFVSPRLGQDELVIFEEGLHHRAVNLFAWDPDGVDRDRLRRYLQAVPPADLVIAVDAPLEVCEARAHLRGLPSRLDGQHSIGTKTFMSNAAEIIDLAVQILQTSDFPTLRVWNGDGMLKEAVDALNDGLDAHLVSRSRS